MHLERLAKLRRQMDAAGLDHLVVPAPENMYYLSGFDGWSFYLHQCLILSGLDERVFWVGRASDLGVARECEVIGQDGAACYPDSFLQSDDKHPYGFVADIIKKAGWNTGRIGVPFDGYFFSPAALRALDVGLPSAQIVPDGNIVNWQRVVKSEQEIALMREAGLIASAALRAGIDAVVPGASSAAVAAEILRAQTGVSIGADGGYPGIQPLIIEGVGPAIPHHTWSSRPLGDTGPLVIEIAGVHQRYHAPVARTVFRGAATREQLAALEAQKACMQAFGQIARDGVATGEIAEALRNILKQHGFDKQGRYGYSTGIAYPPDWGEHTLSIREGDTAILRTGMTIFLIPALWGGPWTVALGEPFVIGPEGAARLANLPFDIN